MENRLAHGMAKRSYLWPKTISLHLYKTMSSDAIAKALGNQMVDFFTWLWSLIPLSVVNWFLYAYTVVSVLPGHFLAQTSRTWTAVIDSFSQDWVHFYKVGDHWFSVTQSGTRQEQVFQAPLWKYTPQDCVFWNQALTGHAHSVQAFDYIGAVYHSASTGMDYDMSEWIANVRVHAGQEERLHVPYCVLVMGWAYSAGTSLLYPVEEDTISFMDMMGDTQTYRILSEEPVVEELEVSTESESEEEQVSESTTEEGEIRDHDQPSDMEAVD